MSAPRVSFVSLGCPKALVDSERIITRLRAEGYEIARKHDGADLVVVNTCGFLDSARDESLGRAVAVKCFDPLGSGQDESVLEILRERFRREARVAAALQHRGVTVVHDFGTDAGVLFLVMELLDGHNLAELIDLNGGRPLGIPEVVDIAEQVASALAYTHRQGIVHRDLKPANVMRLADGTVKIWQAPPERETPALEAGKRGNKATAWPAED